MAIMCKVFGHKMTFNPLDIRPHCIRCGHQDYALDVLVKNLVNEMETDIIDELRNN